VRLPEDDDGLVTSFILVGLCLPVRGGRERERESQVHLVSHILRNIHQVLLWPESSFCFGTSCHNTSSCFLLNCCYFELWPCHKGRGGGVGAELLHDPVAPSPLSTPPPPPHTSLPFCFPFPTWIQGQKVWNSVDGDSGDAKTWVKLSELGLIRQLQMGPDGGKGPLTTKCIRERNIFYFAGGHKIW
jgi:hypothetical protein